MTPWGRDQGQEWDDLAPGFSQFRGQSEGSQLQTMEANLIGLTNKQIYSKILCSSQTLQESQRAGSDASGNNAQRSLRDSSSETPIATSLGLRLHVQLVWALDTTA